MDKKKGLTDDGDGEFILNESGTSVSIDTGNGGDKQENSKADKSAPFEEKKGSSGPEEKDITD